jgi:hypothetical protein
MGKVTSSSAALLPSKHILICSHFTADYGGGQYSTTSYGAQGGAGGGGFMGGSQGGSQGHSGGKVKDRRNSMIFSSGL